MNWELPSRGKSPPDSDLEGYIYHAPTLVFIGVNVVWWVMRVYNSLRTW
jgi:hypothetical protein